MESLLGKRRKVMEKFLSIALVVIFVIWYLSYSATRLDRLHHGTSTRIAVGTEFRWTTTATGGGCT